MQTWRTEKPADTCQLKADAKMINWLDHNGSSLDKLLRPARARDKKVRKSIMFGKICSLASGLRTVRNNQTN